MIKVDYRYLKYKDTNVCVAYLGEVRVGFGEATTKEQAFILCEKARSKFLDSVTEINKIFNEVESVNV